MSLFKKKKPEVFIVEGMTCNHCAMNVQKAIKSVEGVKNATVDLKAKKAFVWGNYEKDKLKKAVEDSGYKVVD